MHRFLMNGIDYSRRRQEFAEASMDPHSHDDTEFGVQYVYCNQHMRVHSVGWCTVSNIEKWPLPGKVEL